MLVFLGCGDDPLYYIKEFPQEVTITIHTNGISLQFFYSSLLLVSFSFSFPLFYDSLAEGLGLIQADEAIGS